MQEVEYIVKVTYPDYCGVRVSDVEEIMIDYGRGDCSLAAYILRDLLSRYNKDARIGYEPVVEIEARENYVYGG